MANDVLEGKPRIKEMRSDAIAYLAYSSVFIAFILGILKFRRLRAEFRVLAIYIFFTGAIQGLSELLSEINAPNLFLSHIYTILGTLLLLWFYQRVLSTLIPKTWFIVVGSVFVSISIINTVFWQPLNTFNSNSVSIQAIIFIILALSTFIQSIPSGENIVIAQNAKCLNWINSGVFIYFTGSLLLFYNGEIIIHVIPQAVSESIWIIHAVLTIVLHLCLFVGLWTSPKK